jgi:hypothetical protein
MIKVGLVVVGLALLAGCANTQAECEDMRVGKCKITSNRLLLDQSLNVEGMGGASISQSSSPEAEAMGQVLGLLGTVLNSALTGRLPQLSEQEQQLRNSLPPLPPLPGEARACPAMGPVSRITPRVSHVGHVEQVGGLPWIMFEAI